MSFPVTAQFNASRAMCIWDSCDGDATIPTSTTKCDPNWGGEMHLDPLKIEISLQIFVNKTRRKIGQNVCWHRGPCFFLSNSSSPASAFCADTFCLSPQKLTAPCRGSRIAIFESESTQHGSDFLRQNATQRKCNVCVEWMQSKSVYTANVYAK